MAVPLNVLVSMMSAPASRYCAWMSAMTSGRVSTSTSLLPFRSCAWAREAIAAEVGLGEAQALHHGAHGAVEDEDAPATGRRRGERSCRTSGLVSPATRLRANGQQHDERIALRARARRGRARRSARRRSSSASSWVSVKPCQRSPSASCTQPSSCDRRSSTSTRPLVAQDANGLGHGAARDRLRGAGPATAAPHPRWHRRWARARARHASR